MAQAVELLSAIRREQLAAAGVKERDLPKHYRPRRPGEQPEKRKSFGQMAKEMLRGGSSGG